MSRLLASLVVALGTVVAAGAQVMSQPYEGHSQGFSGYIYEGASWLNEGGLNDAMFRGSDSLYGINDMLFRVFSGGDRRHRHHQQWWETPDDGFYPKSFVYPVAPVVGPTGPLTMVTGIAVPPGTVAELRVYLNGVEQNLSLAPEMQLQDAPLGGFRYGLHMIVRRPSTGVVVEILSGVGTLDLSAGQGQVELIRQGDRLFLR